MPCRRAGAEAAGGGYAPLRVTVADGWLIAAEAVGWARLGYRKILCVQPFACLPGHIFGKGSTPPSSAAAGARLVSVDYDASTGEGTVLSRIRMLLDEERSGAPDWAIDCPVGKRLFLFADFPARPVEKSWLLPDMGRYL
ncbi:MAG: hypothetical protein ACLTYN_16445 [Dysosmobacter welbionis]